MELHAIATFAGHRSTDSTSPEHLVGRELSAKLNVSMTHLHAWRVSTFTGPLASAACAPAACLPDGDRV